MSRCSKLLDDSDSPLHAFGLAGRDDAPDAQLDELVGAFLAGAGMAPLGQGGDESPPPQGRSVPTPLPSPPSRASTSDAGSSSAWSRA